MSDGLMRERVARALYERRVSTVVLESRGDCPPWDELGYAIMDGYRVDAEAALRALREPTEAMYRATGDLLGPVLKGGGITYERIEQIWAAMIDAALGEGEGWGRFLPRG